MFRGALRFKVGVFSNIDAFKPPDIGSILGVLL